MPSGKLASHFCEFFVVAQTFGICVTSFLSNLCPGIKAWALCSFQVGFLVTVASHRAPEAQL
eukprot:jgi/Botrbrau1/5266/Bobra.0172s0125.1